MAIFFYNFTFLFSLFTFTTLDVWLSEQIKLASKVCLISEQKNRKKLDEFSNVVKPFDICVRLLLFKTNIKPTAIRRDFS